MYQLFQTEDLEVCGLFTVINKAYNRVSMHSTRLELLRKQAYQVNVPLEIITIPNECNQITYNQIMNHFYARVKREDIDHIAFGDLYLEDIRILREEQLMGTGIEPLFPLWKIPTDMLGYVPKV